MSKLNYYFNAGTLGSKTERELLQKIHQVDFVTIPTAKPKKFKQLNPMVCLNRNSWKETIVNETKHITENKNRSVLIICQTVKSAEELYEAFGGKSNNTVSIYTRDYDDFGFGTSTDELNCGLTIIATNLAGRGTDIKISQDLRKNGGLHVCLSYLPTNLRIEQQAFGRAARSGDPGTGQMIILHEDSAAFGNTKLILLKQLRDAEESQRIAAIKDYYDNQIIVEEDAFQTFTKAFNMLKDQIKDVPKEVNEILLQVIKNYIGTL